MKTCSKCGTEKELSAFCVVRRNNDGHSPWCKPCANAYNRAYGQTAAARASAQRRKSTDGYREKSRLFEASASRKEWRRAYDATAARKESRRLYCSTEQGRVVVNRKGTKYRALKLGATVGPIDEAAIYKFCGNRCAYCSSREGLVLDHVVALAAGGSHSGDNLLAACHSCNSSKGAKPVAEWLATRPMTRAAV